MDPFNQELMIITKGLNFAKHDYEIFSVLILLA
jgi:hypothetical protein